MVHISMGLHVWAMIISDSKTVAPGDANSGGGIIVVDEELI